VGLDDEENQVENNEQGKRLGVSRPTALEIDPAKLAWLREQRSECPENSAVEVREVLGDLPEHRLQRVILRRDFLFAAECAERPGHGCAAVPTRLKRRRPFN
jgi:hypothetical protein